MTEYAQACATFCKWIISGGHRAGEMVDRSTSSKWITGINRCT